MGNKPLRVLIVEDSEDDARLVVRALRQRGNDLVYERVETPEAMQAALHRETWDIILSDYSLPHFSGTAALQLLLETGHDIPFIIVSGKIGEETAVEAMKTGAQDYIMKGNLCRLIPTIDRELKGAAERRERKQAQTAINESERKYREMIDFLPITVFEFDKEANITSTNQSAFEKFGYTQEDINRGLNARQILMPEDWDKARKNIQGVLNGEKKSDSSEYTAVRKDGSTFPVLIFSSPIIYQGNPIGLRGALIDITESKQAEANLIQSFKRLQKALDGTIHVLAVAAEKRNPYIAGHQQRVAELACAITKEMDLSEDQIKGIRMGAIIHDIGMISVPADILSKPGRLTDSEFSIVKNHSKAAYDILEGIEFPWPIAEMVHQHHERMNGSGYPRGLSGEDVIVEARILAVADVIEAMSSHRTYRPALGIDVTLEEISQNRDILYDPRVVDFCVKVITEKGFKYN